MRGRSFSSRVPPAPRSSFGGDVPAPPSFSHLAIDLERSGRNGAFFMSQSRLMSGGPLCNCGQRRASLSRHDTRWANFCRGHARAPCSCSFSPATTGCICMRSFCPTTDSRSHIVARADCHRLSRAAGPRQQLRKSSSAASHQIMMIVLGECHLQHALAEFVVHYHAERNHQDLDNELIHPRPRPDACGHGWVAC